MSHASERRFAPVHAESGTFSQTELTGASGVTGAGTDDDSTSGGDDGPGGTGLKLDVETMSAGDEGGPDGCESLVDEANVGPKPQDIIVVVDNSGSMSTEASFVQQQMNSFSVQIGAANIDSHIVLLSAYPTDDASLCGGLAEGWYYDDPNAPSVINVCPQTCTKLQGFAQAEIAIIFGCATIPAG